MIQLVPQLKIYLAVEPVDFRKGIDGLAAVCRDQFQHDPFSGAMYVFRNRSSSALKLLVFDGGGYWLCLKRLSRGRLSYWPRAADEPLTPLAARQLHVLLYNGDPRSAHFADDWRKLP